MLISFTRETSSRPWHFQTTHTSSGAGIRDVNLRDGKARDRKADSPNAIFCDVDRRRQHELVI